MTPFNVFFNFKGSKGKDMPIFKNTPTFKPPFINITIKIGCGESKKIKIKYK
jgi:hypothetical protein